MEILWQPDWKEERDCWVFLGHGVLQIAMFLCLPWALQMLVAPTS